ncbi:MAG: LysR family transcriptional regulator [Betaproteobacteria bacterium]|nr:LysR family transcriptional regulator [Betaproteobacteria bacterium]NBQ09802.1 LysR family transcriptional regulator [Betaproteobacteria bacterium]NCW32373.1 LysR family transcriptional regulator [Betaproteobacteria bacterium]NDA88004.1 LysR family transcriptional regulator [Betaproteobacteria bacterium]NDB41079.1 LysR family transcriptional regulator [Betaproteobacteria bacterium]
MQSHLPRSTDLLAGLHHLKVFVSVAHTGSINRSADQIFKAPSAITRSVSELERLLDKPLFERKPRGMLINPYGAAVLKRSLRIIDEVGQAADESIFKTRSESNVLSNLMMSGQKLQLLVSLHEQRNLTAAALGLGMTQSGASMSLKRIEGALGRPLFQRMQQGLVTTDLGVRLLSRAKRIIAELRHMQSDLSAIAGTLAGHVTIGALPLGRTLLLPDGIATAVKRHPNLRISTLESPYEALVHGLRNGDIDFILGALRSDGHGEGLIVESLFTDRMGILARAGHRLAANRRILLSDLLAEQWILPRPDAPGRRLIDASFSELGLMPPQPSVETGDLAILRRLLNNSDMLTAISPHQLTFEIESGMLVELPVVLGTSTRDIGLTLRRGALLSPAAYAVIEAVRESVGTLPQYHDRHQN